MKSPSSIDIQIPKVKKEISIDLQEEVLVDRVAIVHCCLSETYEFPTAIRIWPTTFLLQEDGERKHLLHSFNITPYPEWKVVDQGHVFTLIFQGLDKHCEVFDLVEDIPEAGGFAVANIKRNKTDVYWVDVD